MPPITQDRATQDHVIEGRFRPRRFVALALTSALAALTLAVGITQGMVSAALSSSSGFELVAPSVSASRLALTAGSAGVLSGSATGDAKTSEAAIARLTGNTLSNGMCIGSNQSFPIIGQLGLSITAEGRVDASSLDLSAGVLDVGDAGLPATTIGVPAGSTDLANAPGTQSGAFGMQASSAGGQQGVELSGVNARAYGATLGEGLKVSSMKVTPRLFTNADAKVCG